MTLNLAMVKKIEGSLASIAIGDALGFPGHDLTQEEIARRFNGPLTAFHDALPDNPYHEGVTAGSITDDTMMTLLFAEAMLDETTPKDAYFFGRVLAKWAKENNIWKISPMFGPTTKASLQQLIDGADPIKVGTAGTTMIHGSSNGAAMRVAPIGLMCPGDVSRAIQLAVAASQPTHGTQTAIAGACAIAAGVAEALNENATVFSVASACLRGAQEGEKIGEKVGRVVPAPNTRVRIEMAIEAAIKAKDIFEAGRLITDCVGNGLPSCEAAPAAVGIFVAGGGCPENTVIGGANIGGDSDTIANMAGAMAGALTGIDTVPLDLYRSVSEKNNLKLHDLAVRMAQSQSKRK